MSNGLAESIDGVAGWAMAQAFGASTADRCNSSNAEHQQGSFPPIPPYYDNIGYADLSDFFYVWLRRSLKSVSPGSVCHARRSKVRRIGSLTLPTRQQRSMAETFFLNGMGQAMRRIAEHAHRRFPGVHLLRV